MDTYEESQTIETSRVDSAIDHAVAKISKADVVLKQCSDEYMAIVVAGPEDTEGCQTADTAAKRMKRLRLDTEAVRKELKRDVLKYGKAIDGEANRIKGLIEPIETHLKKQVDIVRLEAERKKVAAENARRELVAGWVKSFAEIGAPIDLPKITAMTSEEFQWAYLSESRKFNARKEQEQADREELERLRALNAPVVATEVEVTQPNGPVQDYDRGDGVSIDAHAEEVAANLSESPNYMNPFACHEVKHAEQFTQETAPIEHLQAFADHVATMPIPETITGNFNVQVRTILMEAAIQIGLVR